MFSLGSSVHPQRLLFKHQLRVANIFICFNKNKNQGPRTHIISFFCWIGRDQFKLFMVDHYACALFLTNILPFLDICPRRDWMCLKNDGICFSGIWEISFSQKNIIHEQLIWDQKILYKNLVGFIGSGEDSSLKKKALDKESNKCYKSFRMCPKNSNAS